MVRKKKAGGAVGGPGRPVQTTTVYADSHSLARQIAAVTRETMPELWARLIGDRLVKDWEEKQDGLRSRHTRRGA